MLSCFEVMVEDSRISRVLSPLVALCLSFVRMQSSFCGQCALTPGIDSISFCCEEAVRWNSKDDVLESSVFFVQPRIVHSLLPIDYNMTSLDPSTENNAVGSEAKRTILDGNLDPVCWRLVQPTRLHISVRELDSSFLFLSLVAHFEASCSFSFFCGFMQTLPLASCLFRFSYVQSLS